MMQNDFLRKLGRMIWAERFFKEVRQNDLGRMIF